MLLFLFSLVLKAADFKNPHGSEFSTCYSALNDHGKFEFRYAKKEKHPNCSYRHFPWQQQSNPLFFSSSSFGIRCFHKPLGLFVASTTLTLFVSLIFSLVFFLFLHVCANKLKAAARLRGGSDVFDQIAAPVRLRQNPAVFAQFWAFKNKTCSNFIGGNSICKSCQQKCRPWFQIAGQAGVFYVQAVEFLGHCFGRNALALWDQEKGTKAQNICCELSLQRKRAEREKAPRLQPDEWRG